MAVLCINGGDAHTISVSDLSDFGVNTSIRYGTTPTNCNLTSAPNYTQPGYYTVNYAVTYNYSGESMSKNGAAYVMLAEPASAGTGGGETPHVHDYRYYDRVQPTCAMLGYDNFQCNGCGALWKTNYIGATGQS